MASLAREVAGAWSAAGASMSLTAGAGGMSPMATASAGGGSGGGGMVVHIHVGGSLLAERGLVNAVQDAFQRHSFRNVGNGLAYGCR